MSESNFFGPSTPQQWRWDAPAPDPAPVLGPAPLSPPPRQPSLAVDIAKVAVIGVAVVGASALLAEVLTALFAPRRQYRLPQSPRRPTPMEAGLRFEASVVRQVIAANPGARSVSTQVHVPLGNGRARRADIILEHANGSERVGEVKNGRVIRRSDVTQVVETVQGRRAQGKRAAGTLIVQKGATLTDSATRLLSRNGLRLERIK